MSVCDLCLIMLMYDSFCQQTFETMSVLTEKNVKMQKVTVVAVNSRRILGYAKKNLTYKMRSPRQPGVNEIESLILEIIQKNSGDFSSWNLKNDCLIIVTVAVAILTVMILLYVCCKRKRKSAIASGAQEESKNLAEIMI